MNKQELYYIVISGTNNRAQTEMHEPLLIRAEFVDDILKPLADKFEAISVEDFERIFTRYVEY